MPAKRRDEGIGALVEPGEQLGFVGRRLRQAPRVDGLAACGGRRGSPAVHPPQVADEPSDVPPGAGRDRRGQRR